MRDNGWDWRQRKLPAEGNGTLHILLTGGTGQVGTEFQRLAPRDWKIDAPTREILNINDPASIRAFAARERWTAIVNAAAYTAVDRAESEIMQAWQANALGPAALAEVSAETGIPLLHISTDYVFDGTAPRAYVEDDAIGPLGVYGATKQAGEQAVRTANPHHIVLRTAWVVSPHGKNFVKTMLKLGSEQEILRVVNDQRGCPTSAEDIAQTIIALLPQLIVEPKAAAGTYHFVNAGEASWFDLAQYVFAHAAASGFRVPVVEPITTAQYPTPAARPANSRLATGKIERTFAIKPRPWQSAISDVVDACLNSQEGQRP